MACRRMISPDIWEDEDVGTLSNGAFKVFIACISTADDHGKLECSALKIKRVAFGYIDISVEEVEGYLQEVDDTLRSFVRYTVGCKVYAKLLKWKRYQTIRADKVKDSNIPDPSQNDIDSVQSKDSPSTALVQSHDGTSQAIQASTSKPSNATTPSVFGDPETDPHALFAKLINPHPSNADSHGISACVKQYRVEITMEAIREGALQGKDRWCWIAKDILPWIVEAHKPPEKRKPDYFDRVYEPEMRAHEAKLKAQEAKVE